MVGLTLGADAGRMNPEYVLTEPGLERLQAQLTQLRDRRGPTQHQANGDEDAALDARIATLEEVVARAWVVDPASLDAGVVQIGMLITVRDLDSGSRETYRVVGKHEPLRSGELSAASAVGRALLGRAVGEAVSVQLPTGAWQYLHIEACRPAPDR